MELTISQLAERLDAELVGDGSAQITTVAPVEAADATAITFVRDSGRYGGDCGPRTDGTYLGELEASGAGAVIVGKRIEGLAKPQLVVKNVDSALIAALTAFAPRLKPAAAGIDATAKIGRDVKIGEGVAIGPGVLVDDRAEIGTNSVIASGCKIGENSTIGDNCRFDSNVVVYHNCTIGNNVVIQANSTVGSTGFGYSFIDGGHKLIPHNGGVVIEDFVEIGANCCVDRAKFGNTVIKAGTKIDNLVQIAHNVVIGKCCLIAGQVGISGSCTIGDGVVLGGQAGLSDNIEIGDGAMVGAQSGITHNIASGQQVIGSPAYDAREMFRIFGLMKRLPKLAEQLRHLSKRLEELESSKDHKT
ncbi:MAG: UDP-3-O-(3-hydroxymyristoyl)glucosamine N-acyltransferase [Planctomycetota bacterium]|jgi:UDP-3-O-[3-hydroxymyristoyl] glucosamine N-acyltransferase